MEPRFALLLACFFLSGFAALLYQTAWTRELSFVFGTSDLAVAAVLAAYMGGLALGAAAAARYAMRLRRPVLAYGLLELGIAVCALAVPWAIRSLNGIYVGLLGGADTLVGGGTIATAFQLAAAFAVLLPPTALMGATLPLLARHAVHTQEEITRRVGVLYATNTAGAIGGTLVAAFWLLPEIGLRQTVWVGAGLNVAVFLLAAWLAQKAPLSSTPQARPAGGETAAGGRWVLPAIGVSGAVSFAYEVLWTRLLGHLLGVSTHAFATMLASFLLGIALGSAVAARVGSNRERAIAGFALTQLGIALTSYVAFMLADRLPELAAFMGAGPGSPLASVSVAMAVLLPITVCIGATFPFAVRVLARHPDDAASATARVYAWNTVGAIVGSLGAGFFLLPGLGFEGTLGLGVLTNLVLAIAAAGVARPRLWAPVVGAVAAGVVLIVAPPTVPWQLLTSSPIRQGQTPGSVAHYAVGRTTTVMLIERNGRFRLTTDGLPESWIDSKGMLIRVNVAQWLGALPAILRPETRDVLVVGLGGGAMLEIAPQSYATIDVIELEPEVLAANQWVADKRACDPLSDPRTQVHIGDARGALQLTDKRYDAIVSQPSHPWTAGAAHLYTSEFFSLVRSRLQPDGVFVQWIGIGFVDEALVRGLLAALNEAFPHVEVFRPRVNGLLFVGSATPIEVLANARRFLRQAPEDAARLGIHRIEDIASAWVLDEQGARDLSQGVAANTDDHNFLSSRSAQLGEARLDAESAGVFLGPHDPLRGASALDRSALARVLGRRGQANRAIDLAMAGEGAEEEAALGWVEMAAGRTGRAIRHFERAFSLDPGSRDALAGLIAARSTDPEPLRAVAVSNEQIRPGYTAVIEGRRLAAIEDWAAILELDEELAGIEPGDGLYEDATRMRARARISQGGLEAAGEAQALAEVLLLRHWNPYDAMLRARGAIGANRPREAWGSLRRVATGQRRQSVAQRALEIAELLPEEDDYVALREDLRRRGAGRPPSR